MQQLYYAVILQLPYNSNYLVELGESLPYQDAIDKAIELCIETESENDYENNQFEAFTEDDIKIGLVYECV